MTSIEAFGAIPAPRAIAAHAGSHVDDLQVESSVVADVEAILGLEAEWRALERNASGATLFQSFDWCRNHIAFSLGKNDFRPAVLCLRRKGRLIGLLPMAIRRVRGLRVATGLCEPFQMYSEIMLAPGTRIDQIVPALAAQLRQLPADYLHFGQVRADSRLAQCMAALSARSVDADAAPFVDLTRWPDFDSFLKSVNAKTRKNMRNAANRLERTGRLTHKCAVTSAGRREVVERCHAGREAWLKRLGLTSRAFREEDFSAFLLRFADGAATGIETLAMTLAHDDRPIADQWGFVHGGRYYAFMATWDPAYEASSPGRLHLGEVIRTCFERKIAVADFMIPGVPYKFTWTDDAMPVADHVLALNLRGKLQVRLWLAILRPMAKRIVRRFPNGLRGVLVKRVLPWFE